MEDLKAATALCREALKHRPIGHPSRSETLNNLAQCLLTAYKQLGNLGDLEEAITIHREVLGLLPHGNPNRSVTLNNLALCLDDLYQVLGVMSHLGEAIALDGEALELRPTGHPFRSDTLMNLANRLTTRYKHLGTISDLEEAIALNRSALEIYPHNHPNRSSSLSNLAVCLSTRHKQLGGDLEEAIALNTEALIDLQHGNPRRSGTLINLAVSLLTRYDHLGVSSDLDTAIALNRTAVELYPPGHPTQSTSLNNLAHCLTCRYRRLGETGDLEEGVSAAREALQLLPLGHYLRSMPLNTLTNSLLTRFKQSGQMNDQEEAFSLYSELSHVMQTVSSTDLTAAKEWVHRAEEFGHPTTPLAYQTYLQLPVHHLATLPSLPQNLAVLKRHTSSLAVDAFSACIRHNVLTAAVELVEQGRGVFWSQLMRLRSPLDDVIASGGKGKALADEFMQLTSLMRGVFNSPDATQHDRAWRPIVRLQDVVTEIRRLPSFSHFLLLFPFSELQKAAIGGPVIIINASQYGCDVTVILSNQAPVHIPLQITKAHVKELSSQLHIAAKLSGRANVAREVGPIMREVWERVVSPVVSFLQKSQPPGSPIWWCPTAEFTLLPLHAAGEYRKGRPYLSDFYIPSYTPTLTALIHARRQDPSNFVAEPPRFLLVGQADAAGESRLASVGTELANIVRHLEPIATFTILEDQESSVARVSEALSKNEWVRFACHGNPVPKQPFESGFALHDGRLTIERIIRCDMWNPQFAYLSACHTTVGDEESPDEALHLAVAMQFAGFRSVIGTIWAVDDGFANQIASMFYDNMVNESGHLDHTRAALALRRTTKRLVHVPFDQRILFVHMGA